MAALAPAPLSIALTASPTVAPDTAPPVPAPVLQRPVAADPSAPRKLTKKEKKDRARARAAQLAGSPRVTALGNSLSASTARVADVLPGPARAVLEAFVPGATAAAAAELAPLTRPRSLTLLAMLDFALGSVWLVLAFSIYNWYGPPHFIQDGMLFPALSYAVFGVACLVAGFALLGLQPLGKLIHMGLCLAAFFVGGFSIPSAFVLAVYLNVPGIAVAFERPLDRLSDLDQSRVRAVGWTVVLVWVVAVIEGARILWNLALTLSERG